MVGGWGGALIIPWEEQHISETFVFTLLGFKDDLKVHPCELTLDFDFCIYKSDN